MLDIHWHKHVLSFAFEARTSRGILRERPVWFIFIRDTNSMNSGKSGNSGEVVGWGECAPLSGLSLESATTVEAELAALPRTLSAYTSAAAWADTHWQTRLCASVRFGVEMALKDLITGGQRVLFPDNDFVQGSLGTSMGWCGWRRGNVCASACMTRWRLDIAV